MVCNSESELVAIRLPRITQSSSVPFFKRVIPCPVTLRVVIIADQDPRPHDCLTAPFLGFLLRFHLSSSQANKAQGVREVQGCHV